MYSTSRVLAGAALAATAMALSTSVANAAQQPDRPITTDGAASQQYSDSRSHHDLSVPPATASASRPAQLVDSSVARDPSADIKQALDDVGGQFGTAVAVGSTIGGIAGFAVGCPIGVVTGGTMTAVVSLGTLTPLGIIGGCVIGGGTFGGAGAVLGAAVVAIPVGVAGLSDAYRRLHAQGDIAARIPAPSTPFAVAHN